ncbi:unnamed protein product [Prunus armeniaca]
MASGSSKEVDKGKDKATPTASKRRSMRTLQTRFASTRKNKGEGSKPEVIVTIDDDDDGSDKSGAVETEVSIHREDNTHSTGDVDENLDKDQYYSHDEDTYLDFDTHLEELDASDILLELASDREQRVDIALVVPTAGDSSEAGLEFPATVFDVVLGLPAAQLPAPPILGTSDMQYFLLLLLSWAHPTWLLAPLHHFQQYFLLLLLSRAHLTWLPAPLHSFRQCCLMLELLTTATRMVMLLSQAPPGGIYSRKACLGRTGKIPLWRSKPFFDDGVTILRSIDELLPLCHRFNGYVTFQGALVYSETVEALKKFMEKYRGLMEATNVTSSFSRCTAFRALGLVLQGIDTMQLLDITDHKLLCWRDAICEAIILGFHVEFLLKLVKNLEHAVFGAQAIHSMQSSHDSDEVKAAVDALSIKQQELENQRREMHALLLAKGISVDSAECVTEAASRLSPRASFVLFGRSP